MRGEHCQAAGAAAQDLMHATESNMAERVELGIFLVAIVAFDKASGKEPSQEFSW
jgi:hypothetical protein